jgi:hypothetical protein
MQGKQHMAAMKAPQAANTSRNRASTRGDSAHREIELVTSSRVDTSKHTMQQTASLFLRCDACQLHLFSNQSYEVHRGTEGHRSAMARLASSHFIDHATAGGVKHCVACDADIPLTQWPLHVQDANHAKRQREHSDRVDATLAEAELDKHGVMVSSRDGIDFGMVDIEHASRGSGTKGLSLTIQYTGTEGLVSLASYQLASAGDASQISR